MNKLLIKVFMALNIFALRVSRGHIGNQLGSQTILLLHTTGRKSGRQIITPIAYFHTDDVYFLVGSNWGKDSNASWFLNLLAQTRTRIEVQGKTIPVDARRAEGMEYERLWKYAIQHHPPYIHYKEMTERHIPIVILTPVA